jgi:hypothetical protein
MNEVDSLYEFWKFCTSAKAKETKIVEVSEKWTSHGVPKCLMPCL